MPFLSTATSFINSCCNFNLDFLRLVRVASMAAFGVGTVGTFGVASAATFGVGSAACSGVCSLVGILSKFGIRNNLLLKLSRLFSLALNKNLVFQVFLYVFQNSLIQ